MKNNNDYIHNQIMSVVIHAENILKREGVKFHSLLDKRETPTICNFTIRGFTNIDKLYEYMHQLFDHPVVENIYINDIKNSIDIIFIQGDELLKYIRKEKIKKLFNGKNYTRKI